MKHITLVSFVVATLILSIAGCSQLSEEEIAELVAAEVSKQTSQISDIVATTTLDIANLNARLNSGLDGRPIGDVMKFIEMRYGHAQAYSEREVDDHEGSTLHWEDDKRTWTNKVEANESYIWNLEDALYGFGGTPSSTSNQIGTLEDTVEDLERALYGRGGTPFHASNDIGELQDSTEDHIRYHD